MSVYHFFTLSVPHIAHILVVAIRVLRAAAELGWSTVAVYTGNDVSHATYADEVVELDNVARYMDAQYLVDVARKYCYFFVGLSSCTSIYFVSQTAVYTRPPSLRFPQ